MRRIVTISVVLLVVSACALRGSGDDEEPIGVGTALESAVIGDELHVHGEISLLGDLFCPCFHVTSAGGTIVVWYDLMTDEAGEAPAIDVEGFVNGDEAVVIGEYRSADPGTGFPVVWAEQVTPYR